MADIAVLAVVVLAVLFAGAAVVIVQIHLEEHAHRMERRKGNQRSIPLARPPLSGWARFARSVCGVYIADAGEEPALELWPEEVLPWYQRSSGPDPELVPRRP